MKYKIIFIFFILVYSCKKQEKTVVRVIGHGGNGLEFPGSVYHGNSKEAMDFTFSNPNADGVELDLRMAQDGTLWLSHDEILDNETNSSGCVANKMTEELKDVKYKSLQNEKLAKLVEIESFRESSKYIYVDVKHANSCSSIIQNEVQYLQALDTWKKSIVNSDLRIYIILNNEDWIQPFVQEGWRVLFSTDDSQTRANLLIQYPSLTGFVCKNSLCSESQVDDLKSQGKEIYLYEVRSPKSLKEVRKKNPTGVISDDVQGAILEFK